MSNFNSLYYRFKNIDLDVLETLCSSFQLNGTEKVPANYEQAIDIREIYLSNSMEGNTCNLLDTKMLIEDNITPEGKRVTEIMEVINLNRCLKKYKKIRYITPELIRDIHSIVTYYILETAGEFRECPVYISGSNHMPCKFDVVEENIYRICYEFTMSRKTLKDIFKFKHKLVYIHPFEDGNGRVSRVILNALLAGHGYTRLLVYEDMRKQYYKSLELASVEGKMDAWYRFCYLGILYNLYKVNDSRLDGLDIF